VVLEKAVGPNVLKMKKYYTENKNSLHTTKRKAKMLDLERGSTRSHPV
jgi:hypothetical protein